jgi:hypothetical protein
MILTRVVNAARDVVGDGPLLLKETVDTVADRDRVAPGLDMHVGGATLDRTRDDLIDQPNDRRLVGNVAQPLDIVFGAVAGGLHGDRGPLEIPLGSGIVVERAQGALDLGGHDQRELDLEVQHVADRADDIVDERIRARDQDPAIAMSDRQDAVGPEESVTQAVGKDGARRDFRLAHHAEAAIRRVDLAKIGFGDQAKLDENEVEALARDLGSSPRPGDGGTVEIPFGVQQTGECLGKTGILGAQESDTAGAGDRLHKLLKFDGHKRSDRLEDRFPRDSRAG